MTANTYKAIIRQQPDVKCAPLFGLRLGLAQLLAASQKLLTSTQKNKTSRSSRYGSCNSREHTLKDSYLRLHIHQTTCQGGWGSNANDETQEYTKQA